MSTTFRTLDEIHTALGNLPGEDRAARTAMAGREATLTKPAGALGRLEGVSAWMGAWQGTATPRADAVRVLVFAGNHGVAAQGVSAYPPSVTVQMVANFEAGGAAINQLCDLFGLSLDVVALDLETPTGDITREPALSEAEFLDAFGRGGGAVADASGAADLLCLGEMGIANTTAAAALAAALFGGDAAAWTGAGTGVAGTALTAKKNAVTAALEQFGEANRQGDPIEALRRLGGREFAAIAGAVLSARRLRIPVVLDGFAVWAAAAALEMAASGALDHCLAAHVSTEPGHRRLLDTLGRTPLLDLGLRLGEGTGAALAVPLIRSALACHAGMATFEDARVDGKKT